MACQQKVLDDLQKPSQYSGVVLTVGTSRAPIREAIARSGLTNEQAAERIGISPVTLSRWVNGHSDPSFSALDKLADEIGQPIVLTFGEHKDAPAPEWVRGLQHALAAVLRDRGLTPDDAEKLSEGWAVLERARKQQSPALDVVLFDPDV